MRIGIIGLGKTGSIVAESVSADSALEVAFVITGKRTDQLYDYPVGTAEDLDKFLSLYAPDVLLDFSVPEATLEIVQRLPKGTAIVIGTTGFTPLEVEMLKSMRDKLRILFAPNISDGINLLMGACKYIRDHWPKADVVITEEHFKGKKDAPSGTAQAIGNLFRRDISYNVVRAGGIVGVHEVKFVTDNQMITIKHTSFSREVFAEASKRAVAWIVDKEPGFYEIAQMYE